MKIILKIATIVAGLAAMSILPLLFMINRGEFPEEIIGRELETVQVAMNVMMVSNEITTVSANDNTTKSLGVNSWAALPEGPGAEPLALYIRGELTDFYYCWDTSGYVYPQTGDPEVGNEPGECPQPSSRFRRTTLDRTASSE